MRCSFCGKNFKTNQGKMFVKTSGEIFYFCSSKCDKNHALGRIGKRTKWAKKK